MKKNLFGNRDTTAETSTLTMDGSKTSRERMTATLSLRGTYNLLQRMDVCN